MSFPDVSTILFISLRALLWNVVHSSAAIQSCQNGLWRQGVSSTPRRCSCHTPCHCPDSVCLAQSHAHREGRRCLVPVRPPHCGRPTSHTRSCCRTRHSTRPSCPRASSQRSRTASCSRSQDLGMSSSASAASAAAVPAAPAVAVAVPAGRQPNGSAPWGPPALSPRPLSCHSRSYESTCRL